MALETRHVFLDTEFFVANNFEYDREPFKTLIDEALNDELFIHITNITQAEVTKQLKESLDLAFTELNKLRRHQGCRVLLNLPGSYNEVFGQKPDKNYLLTQLEEQFADFLDNCSVDVISTASVSVSSIFEKYFSSKPPFGKGEKKHEFPDAFAVAAMEDWCRENNQKMYLVSKDNDMISAAATSGFLISSPTVDPILDELSRFKDGGFYALIRSVFDSDKNVIEEKIVEAFEESEVYLDELNGEVEQVTVTHVEITRSFLINSDDRATFSLDGYIEYNAKISYAETMIDGMAFGDTQEEITRTARLSADVVYYVDASRIEIELSHVELNQEPIILYRGYDEED